MGIISEELGLKRTSDIVFIPAQLYDLLEMKAKVKGSTVDREATEILELNIDVLEHQFKTKNK